MKARIFHVYIYIYNAYMYRVRWSPSTNEFVGTNDQHKNKITSYKFEVFLNSNRLKTPKKRRHEFVCFYIFKFYFKYFIDQ
jgi:hypothetical protein